MLQLTRILGQKYCLIYIYIAAQGRKEYEEGEDEEIKDELSQYSSQSLSQGSLYFEELAKCNLNKCVTMT